MCLSPIVPYYPLPLCKKGYANANGVHPYLCACVDPSVCAGPYVNGTGEACARQTRVGLLARKGQ